MLHPTNLPTTAAAAFRRPFVVRGSSMLPTLRDGDLLQVTPHRPAAIRQPHPRQLQRGQLVIAHLPNAPQRMAVKRIVALPGEYIRPDAAGRITINDAPLPEPYLHPDGAPTPSSASPHFPAGFCGDDEYFLLGDNRALRESADSRRYGPTPASCIIAIVRFRWPRLPLRLGLPLPSPLRRPGGTRRASPVPPPASAAAPAQE